MVLGSLVRSFGRSPFFTQMTALLRGNSKYLTAPKWKRMSLTAAVFKDERETLSITFVARDGKSYLVHGKEGDTLLDMYQNSGLDFPGFGNCGGTLSCSTCLIILSAEDYKKSLNPDMAAENDMIDLSGCLHATSRLGCQVRMGKALDGMVAIIPQMVKDLREMNVS